MPGRTKMRASVGMAAAALLTLSVSAPATAVEVAMIDVLPAGPPTCDAGWAPVGQTFIATQTGELTQIGIYTVGPERTTDLTLYAGLLGTSLATQTVSIPEVTGTVPELTMTTLTTPVPIASGSTYAFTIANGTCSPAFTLFAMGEPYADGDAFDLTGLVIGDLAFRIVVDDAPADADDDGVPDSADACPDSTFTQGPAKLKPNNYWSTSAAGFVDRTGTIGYTLDETGGCSAEQIVAAAGLGRGHLKNGISVDAMDAWVASLAV